MSHLAFKYLAFKYLACKYLALKYPALKYFLIDLLVACAAAPWPVPKACLASVATRRLRRGRRS